jgi:DNA-binding FadR family transcriptional regulator
MKNERSSKPMATIGLSAASGSAEFALGQMRNFIEHGRFEMEGRLPPERELAAQLRVGRSTLRKALEILEAEGEIWRHVGQGTFVGRRSSKLQAETFMNLSKVSPRELLDARLCLEPAIAASAAVTAQPSDIAQMRMSAEKRENTKLPEAYNLWDHQLHLAIAEATRNPIMVALLERLNGLRRAPTWTSYKKDRMKEPYYSISKREHREIIAAIEQRDSARAFRAMKNHILSVHEGFSAWSDDAKLTAAE